MRKPGSLCGIMEPSVVGAAQKLAPGNLAAATLRMLETQTRLTWKFLEMLPTAMC